MDPDILFPSHIPVIYTPEWTRWSQAPPRGPGGSRWIRAFIYHKCNPGINSCQEKALLAKLRTALKGAKEPQESWVFLLNSLNFEALHNSSIAQNNHSGKRKEKEKIQRKNPNNLFCCCWDFQLSSSLLGQFMPGISRNSLWPWCWVNLGVQSRSRAWSGRNLGEIWEKSMPRILCRMNRAGNFCLGHLLWPLVSPQDLWAAIMKFLQFNPIDFHYGFQYQILEWTSALPVVNAMPELWDSLPSPRRSNYGKLSLV